MTLSLDGILNPFSPNIHSHPLLTEHTCNLAAVQRNVSNETSVAHVYRTASCRGRRLRLPTTRTSAPSTRPATSDGGGTTRWQSAHGLRIASRRWDVGVGVGGGSDAVGACVYIDPMTYFAGDVFRGRLATRRRNGSPLHARSGGGRRGRRLRRVVATVAAASDQSILFGGGSVGRVHTVGGRRRDTAWQRRNSILTDRSAVDRRPPVAQLSEFEASGCEGLG